MRFLKKSFRIAALLLSLVFLLVGCSFLDDSIISEVNDKESAFQKEQALPFESESIEEQSIDQTEYEEEQISDENELSGIDEDGTYTSKDDVALYIHTFGHLPSNFIKKKDAQELGWPGGSLEEYASGKSIGGDRFGNYEGQLPKKSGRSYTECDIDTMGAKSRGAKRIVFSNDGLVYYTEDHYETFTLLYGNP